MSVSAIIFTNTNLFIYVYELLVRDCVYVSVDRAYYSQMCTQDLNIYTMLLSGGGRKRICHHLQCYTDLLNFKGWKVSREYQK